MSILRTLVLAGTIGLSTVVIGFVSADRLAQQGGLPAARAAAAPPEPRTTGTLPQGAPAQATVTQGSEAEVRPARVMSGFDTERLNALMRGEMPPPPEPAPPARPRRR